MTPDRATRAHVGQTVAIWQSDALTRVLASVLVVPLTTNMERAHLAGTAVVNATDEALGRVEP